MKKIIACSDLHIPFTSRYFITFADYACNSDIVVFNGDILDLVRCSVEEIKNSKTGKELLDALKKIVQKTKTFFIIGNHDPQLGGSLTELGIEVEAAPSY
ncbi:hypothetical protein DRO59_05215, partial [Candidatus Bathyarchaeota archaeon]